MNYDGYEKFDQQYGHLFTNIAYSHYIVRLEYPRRRWLSLIALAALLFGMMILARGADKRTRWTGWSG